jgi:hypothetical protein
VLFLLQVTGMVAAVSDTASHWWGTNSSNIRSWVSRTNQLLPSWPKGASKASSKQGSSNGEAGDGSEMLAQDAQPTGSSKQQKQQQPQQQQPAGGGHHQEQQLEREESPHPLSSVDLSHVVKAWGWKGDEKLQQQQQQQQNVPEPSPQPLREQQLRATAPADTSNKSGSVDGSSSSSNGRSSSSNGRSSSSNGRSSSQLPLSSIMAALHSVVRGSSKGSSDQPLQHDEQPPGQQQHHMGAAHPEQRVICENTQWPVGPGIGDLSNKTAAAATTAAQVPRRPSADVHQSNSHPAPQDQAVGEGSSQQPAVVHADGPVTSPVADLAAGVVAKQQQQMTGGGLLNLRQQQQQQRMPTGEQIGAPPSTPLPASSRSGSSSNGSGAAPAAGVLLSSHPLIVLPSAASGSSSNSLWSADCVDEEEQQQRSTDAVQGGAADASSSDEEF